MGLREIVQKQIEERQKQEAMAEKAKSEAAAIAAAEAARAAADAERAAAEAKAEAEVKAVKPHLLHDLEKEGRLLYFRMLMILLHEYKPIFSDENKAALALRKWSRSMGFDEKVQNDIKLEVSYYDNVSQQEVMERFAKAADKGCVCCLFCDFMKLHGEKYILEGDLLAFIRELLAGVFRFASKEVDALELLCRMIASEQWSYTDKLVDLPKEVIDRYAANRPLAYLVIDLSKGPKASMYPTRYVDTAPDLSSDTCRTTELWLKHVSKGSFVMGGVAYHGAPHEVTLSQDYYIGVFPVTQRQWELVMGDNSSSCKNSGTGAPVEMVSYDDICGENRPWPKDDSVTADSFFGRLRTKTGLKTIDLPSEAQWEHACRAGSAEEYWGLDIDQVAWYENNSDNRTHKVGQKTPNPWGLYDMLGNVWEWCKDWYGRYPNGQITDPAGDDAGSIRVCRGGGCYNFAGSCSAARRSADDPSVRGDDLGFRLALVPVQ